MKWNDRTVTYLLLACGVLLRVLLCWANPPENAFDDHFEPIFMIMKSGSIPAKDACFQCYHPPVFYWISAMVGNIAAQLGVTLPHLFKLLQFITCLYGVLTVGICLLIIEGLPLSNFARHVSFGTVCFLPRHIYMSAMNSNDTMSYFLVALCLYLLMVMADKRFPPLGLFLLGAAFSVTIFVKYTNFIILPAALTAFLLAIRSGLLAPRKKGLLLAGVTLLLPLSLLTVYMTSNLRDYGSPLPWNVALFDPSAHYPRDSGGINFFTFKPWEDVEMPVLAPGKLNSFWTLIYSGMWFDTEPYFMQLLASDKSWWEEYSSWYEGEGPFPERPLQLPALTRLSSAGLILMGMVPFVTVLIGVYCYAKGRWVDLLKPAAANRVIVGTLPVLFLFNTAGVIALTLRMPVFNAMKASYLLNSTPAFMVFLGIGTMCCEQISVLKRMLFLFYGALFLLVTVHILHIVSKTL